MAEIKRGLWEVDRRDASLKKQMHLLHTEFANKIILNKKNEALASERYLASDEREVKIHSKRKARLSSFA
jgi:hypothetical protein